jgi:LmbE family N-acetylglucosaminyl deacetylase
VTPNRRLALVYAHPDDDVWGTAGTLALEEGRVSTTAVVATSGEAGPLAEEIGVARDDLSTVREDEERAGLAASGAGDADIHFLRYPDGGLEKVDRAELVDRIAAVLDAARPQVVVTFGPEGITRHPDHIAIGQAATEAFHRLQAEAEDDAFARLFYTAIPQGQLDRWRSQLRASGADPGDPDAPFMPRGVPDHTVTAVVDTSSVKDRKLAAVRAHRTQAQEIESMPEAARDQMFVREWFVQAFPPVTEPGGPVLGGLFEGLDR